MGQRPTKDRLIVNLNILEKIVQYVIDNPEQRFHQVLANMDINRVVVDKMSGEHYYDDLFYEESDETYKRIK